MLFRGQPVSTKLVLQKKKAKEGKSKYDTEDRDFPVPVSVTVTRREPTQDEEDTRDEAREKFMEVSEFLLALNMVSMIKCLLVLKLFLLGTLLLWLDLYFVNVQYCFLRIFLHHLIVLEML